MHFFILLWNFTMKFYYATLQYNSAMQFFSSFDFTSNWETKNYTKFSDFDENEKAPYLPDYNGKEATINRAQNGSTYPG